MAELGHVEPGVAMKTVGYDNTEVSEADMDKLQLV